MTVSQTDRQPDGQKELFSTLIDIANRWTNMVLLYSETFIGQRWFIIEERF